MVSPSLSIDLRVKEGFSRGDRLGHLVGCPTRRERAEGSPEDDIGAIILEWGFLSSEHTSMGFQVRGALSNRVRYAVAQLGKSLLG